MIVTMDNPLEFLRNSSPQLLLGPSVAGTLQVGWRKERFVAAVQPADKTFSQRQDPTFSPASSGNNLDQQLATSNNTRNSRGLSMVTIFILFFISQSALCFSLYDNPHFSIDLKGSYKNLGFISKRRATDTVIEADINRLRTEWDVHALKAFSAKVIWDNEIIGGRYGGTEEFAARQGTRGEPYLNMDYELVRKNRFFYGQQFYRAYFKFDQEPVTLVMGRQKIDWGVMHAFSPVDLFTRLPIFDIEKEERVGNTAANLMIAPREGLKLNMVYAFHPTFDRSRLAGRVTKTLGHYDVSVLGGRFLRDKIFGFDFTGDLKKAGVRGELIYDHADVGKNFVQGAVGIDYGFENTFYFLIEYFYNGQGTNNATTLTPFPPSGVQIQSVHQNFLATLVKYEPTPLWRVSLQNDIDLNGGSFFINPETKYSFYDWLEGVAGAHFPIGRSQGEFTPIPNVYYFQTQVYF